MVELTGNKMQGKQKTKAILQHRKIQGLTEKKYAELNGNKIQGKRKTKAILQHRKILETQHVRLKDIVTNTKCENDNSV